MSKIISFIKANKFNTISWGLTFVLVVSILFGGYSWKQSTTVQALQPEPTKVPDAKQPHVEMPAIGGGSEAFLSIARDIELKTNSPADKPRYAVEDYRVSRGDSVFAIGAPGWSLLFSDEYSPLAPYAGPRHERLRAVLYQLLNGLAGDE